MKHRFHYSINRFDRIPEDFLDEKIKVNQPYIPDTWLISKEIMDLEKEGGGKKTST